MIESPVEAAPVQAPDLKDPRAKRSVKKRKNNYFMLKLIAGWSVVLALIVFGARKMWPNHAPAQSSVSATAPAALDMEEDMIMLKEGGPKCGEAMSGFLSAGTPEERNQFVLAPVATASRMARFYSLNPMASVNPSTLVFEKSGVVNLAGRKAIETLWKTEDGRTLDVNFREENGEWRLDWDHFARYSDYPWSLFLAGSGAPEGEFRLLARERLAEERKDAEAISVVLYAPRFGHPGDTGFQSPEFLVSRNKPEGKLLDAAFKMARSGRQVYDSKLPNLNPEGMIRVRVKIKRTEVNMERRFEITAVQACHWFSIDDPGVAAEKPAEAKPAEN